MYMTIAIKQTKYFSTWVHFIHLRKGHLGKAQMIKDVIKQTKMISDALNL